MNLSKITVIGTSVLLVLIVPLFTKCSSEYGVESRVGTITSNFGEESLPHSLKVMNGTSAKKLSKSALGKIQTLEDTNNKLEVENSDLTKQIYSMTIMYKKKLEDSKDKIESLSSKYQKKLEDSKTKIALFKTTDDQRENEMNLLIKENKKILKKNIELQKQLSSLSENLIEKVSIQKIKTANLSVALTDAKQNIIKEIDIQEQLPVKE